MKRIVVSVHWPQLRSRWRKVLVTGRAYVVLSFCSMAVFVLLGLAGMLQNAASASPVQSMKGFASSVSGSFFRSLLGMELPHMQSDPKVSPLQADRVAGFLLRFLTELNPNDPKSLLAREMPGMSADKSVLLRQGSGGADEAPVDHSPWEDDVTAPADSNSPVPGTPAAPEDRRYSEQGEPAEPGTGSDSPVEPVRTTGEKKVVFIYHSHNRESYFPELKPGAKDASSGSVNVTLVGKRLASRLEAKGIGASHSSRDYPVTVTGFNYNLSYKYSLQTLSQAVAANRSLKFFFDIHRDSQRRSKTTATINGVDYAQVYFIIGHRNPSWKENEAFASKIHDILEKQYPGLSRGIWAKANGNGEYNQSISPDSVLIEIGGVDNTLKECYRTADVLADVIADLYWQSQDAVKADAQTSAS
ncbi:stage II sporulation protein P [Cohnella pontilimi]|uniref:Stage II sporulation protein P n=1 Tax=Cohnella pontilimi TaxID=2564100 RepID=A0A4U0FEV0_9BACL|nr:stage II sporulation protein P [Cohnella pontilimi]TJY43473.1 stage II sporulation protein P [Cohnella pontilimi]